VDATLITILAQEARSGTVATPIVAVPTGAVTVVLQAVMNAADIGVRGNVVNLCVIWSTDLYTPAHGASCVWMSGLYRIKGGGLGNSAPGLRMTIPRGVLGFSGQLISPQSLAIGLEMDMLDASGNTLLSAAPVGLGMSVDVPVYPVLIL
jgi:hypothetical protein